MAAAQTRINQLLSALQNVAIMSVSDLAELKTLVSQERVKFDAMKLSDAVTTMKAKVEEQRVWLTNREARKTHLQAQIQRLKDVRRQLKP